MLCASCLTSVAQARLVVHMDPSLPIPGIRKIDVSTLSSPTVEFKMVPFTVIPGLAGTINSLITGLIDDFLLFPNVLEVPICDQTFIAEGTDGLYAGILIGVVTRGFDLIDRKYHHLKSDGTTKRPKKFAVQLEGPQRLAVPLQYNTANIFGYTDKDDGTEENKDDPDKRWDACFVMPVYNSYTDKVRWSLCCWAWRYMSVYVLLSLLPRI